MRDRERLLNEIVEFQRLMHESDAWRCYVRLKRIEVSYHIYQLNSQDLLRGLGQLNEPETMLKVWDESKPEVFEAVMTHMMRLFHNFLAAAVMLADHTQVFAKESYSDALTPVFEREFQARWRDLPIYTFVRRLRVYVLHIKQPLWVANVNFTPIGTTGTAHFDCAVRLNMAEMRDWDGWKATGRAFLAELEGDPRFEAVAQPHDGAVANFFQWMFQWHEHEVFAEEFSELAEFRRRERELWVGLKSAEQDDTPDSSTGSAD